MINLIKNISLLSIAVLIFTSFSSFSAKFEAGKHYNIVSETKTSNAELTEYFSYYCPTCRAYEPYLDGFKKVMPDTAKFNKVHVDFMGQTSPEIQFMLSKALIIAEKLNLDIEFSSAVFKYLQTDRQAISHQQDIRNIFVAIGGNAQKFDQGMKSFAVIGQANKEKKVQDMLSQNSHLTSVPAMVVNGKYLINSKALDRNNFFTEYNQLVAYLFTL